MATKFKFEIESDGLNTVQTTAFAAFINALGGQVSSKDSEATQHHFDVCSEDKITPDYAEGVKKDIAEAVENTKKKRASRAKVEEVISETPMQIDARNMDSAEEAQAEEAQAEEAQAEEAQAEEAQAEEAQAEEAQAEEAQAEDKKTSTFSIQDVRDRVKEKQVKWRTSIKAELERLGSSSVSLLDPEHFEEFCNFMDNLA